MVTYSRMRIEFANSATAERRSKNLSYQFSYTYSHALDENSTNPGTIVNSYDEQADYGNSDQDIPNRFVR